MGLVSPTIISVAHLVDKLEEDVVDRAANVAPERQKLAVNTKKKDRK